MGPRTPTTCLTNYQGGGLVRPWYNISFCHLPYFPNLATYEMFSYGPSFLHRFGHFLLTVPIVTYFSTFMGLPSPPPVLRRCLAGFWLSRGDACRFPWPIVFLQTVAPFLLASILTPVSPCPPDLRALAPVPGLAHLPFLQFLLGSFPLAPLRPCPFPWFLHPRGSSLPS